MAALLPLTPAGFHNLLLVRSEHADDGLSLTVSNAGGSECSRDSEWKVCAGPTLVVKLSAPHSAVADAVVSRRRRAGEEAKG